jgi:putative hydrolase of the HAD superfamily
MLRGLLFDLDNTLYSCRYGLEDNVRRRMKEFNAAFLGVSPEEAWRERKAQAGRYGTNLEWLMGEKGFTAVEAYFAAVHPPNEADSLPPNPALRSFLESITLPKAILTNAPGEHAGLILGKLGISDLFIHVFDIRQCGFKGKPRAEVFTHALNVLGMRVDEVLFVDDTPQYVDGFIAIGGRGVLFDETGAHTNYGNPRIRALEELRAYLDLR